MNNQDFDPELISILTPTYNRHKFLPLYIMNLQTIDYPKELLEVVIDDDGADAFIKDLDAFKNAITPIKVNYMRYKNPKVIRLLFTWTMMIYTIHHILDIALIN